MSAAHTSERKVSAIVIPFRALKTVPRATRRRIRTWCVHERILDESYAWYADPHPQQLGKYRNLIALLSSALSDALSRRNRRRPMVHYFRGRNYRMAVEGFDRVVVYDYTTRQKLASTACFAL